MKVTLMNDQQPILSLTFERPFRFEAPGSTEDAAQALKILASKDSTGAASSAISLSPIPHGYSFHYELRRFDKNSRACTTAVSNGKIWQRANGIVVVQGTAQVDPWGFYGALIVSALLCFTSAISMIEYAVVFGLIFVALVIGILVLYYGDRNRLIDLLSNISQSGKKIQTSAL